MPMPNSWTYSPRYSLTRLTGNRSNPASTAVWVVKRLPGLRGAERLLEPHAIVLHVAAGPLQDGEGGVPLVEVADLGLDTQSREAPASRRCPG